MITATRIFAFVLLTSGSALAMEHESRIPRGILKRATAAYTASQTKNVGADFVLANHLVPYECLERQLLGTSPPAEQTDEEKHQEFLAQCAHREIVAKLEKGECFKEVSDKYPPLFRQIVQGSFGCFWDPNRKILYLQYFLDQCSASCKDGIRGIGYFAHHKKYANLSSLNLGRTNSGGISELPAEIVKLTALSDLWINQTLLRDLPPAITQLTGLKRLSLWRNKFEEFPAALRGFTTLRHLELNCNAIESVPPLIGSLVGLKNLSFASNYITYLPDEVTQLTNLRFLNFSHNRLGTVPLQLGRLPSLKTLCLYNNGISVLPDEMNKFTNLTKLTLGYNQLRCLPDTMSDLNLTEIDLSQNPLVEDAGKMKKIKYQVPRGCWVRNI